ncbi:MAG: ABC transporter ATP-binding protein [Proteobacteria bacterium]|nr:ABC transporter ATP-binding protein [Pseudomonadota bacterium]HQR04625.1 ABC transporter ATP-binding protein [Rhodocyclaceae bacterium]
MIRLTGIQRHFQVGGETVHALRGIDLAIGAGEYIAILGPSGSGKSSLLNIIGLLDHPSAGQYELDGRDVTALADDEQARVRREKIGFVFQFFHLVPRLTAAENIALPMVLAGVEPSRREERVAWLLEAYGLANRAHHRPDQLSGGQCQRVAIARAMSMSPPVIVADEPTGNLDRHTSQEVITLLESLHAAGSTLIVVTHDPSLGARATRQLHLDDGLIAERPLPDSPAD